MESNPKPHAWRADRFRQEIDNPQLERARFELDVVARGHEDDRDFAKRLLRPELLADSKAVATRQLRAEQDEIRSALAYQPGRLGAVGCGPHVRIVREGSAENLERRWIVVDDQKAELSVTCVLRHCSPQAIGD